MPRFPFEVPIDDILRDPESYVEAVFSLPVSVAGVSASAGKT